MIGNEAVVAMETPRLRLRTFRTGDLAHLVAMNADPTVMAHLGGPMSPEASLAMAEAIQHAFLAEGIGMIAVERRADEAFLGIAGLNRLAWYPDDLEVGWRLLPAHWGRGYATEAGRAWLGYAFRRHGVARVISVADVPNRRSRAVMERLGLQLDHTALLQEGEDRFEAAVHAITRAEWERQPAS
ncbi:GNAT family N-acetyltransferase [Rubellimicrobium aerolatum]|uniref:GNAT family N-acetyltransferase n=1 Tax=Rubellimicrobium aerolatum TaxID=490979 RepID=A0ABW0SE78_9RHOB